MDQDRGSSVNIPWMVLGDFNSVTSPKEKEFGADVTAYETRDIHECFISLGMVDMVSVGCFFTWTKNSIWCKLDRVMVNHSRRYMDKLISYRLDAYRITLLAEYFIPRTIFILQHVDDTSGVPTKGTN